MGDTVDIRDSKADPVFMNVKGLIRHRYSSVDVSIPHPAASSKIDLKNNIGILSGVHTWWLGVASSRDWSNKTSRL
jgi:hypothetical protein